MLAVIPPILFVMDVPMITESAVFSCEDVAASETRYLVFALVPS